MKSPKDGEMRLIHQKIFHQEGTIIIARFFLIAGRTLAANRSGAMGRRRSQYRRWTSGGIGSSDLPCFPPSRIGVRITPGQRTLTRTPAAAASARREMDRPTTPNLEAA